jgi:hypothetical protein
MKKQKDKDEKNKKLIELYIDKDLLKLYEIDIQKDIIDTYKTLEFDKYKIKNALKLYNSKQETKINTKSLYGSWASSSNTSSAVFGLGIIPFFQKIKRPYATYFIITITTILNIIVLLCRCPFMRMQI